VSVGKDAAADTRELAFLAEGTKGASIGYIYDVVWYSMASGASLRCGPAVAALASGASLRCSPAVDAPLAGSNGKAKQSALSVIYA
jgi:hypothetical protein